MRIRDPGWRQFGSGIRDKHPGSATLMRTTTFCSPNQTKPHTTPFPCLLYVYKILVLSAAVLSERFLFKYK
jgi:hypothetical protein